MNIIENIELRIFDIQNQLNVGRKISLETTSEDVRRNTLAHISCWASELGFLETLLFRMQKEEVVSPEPSEASPLKAKCSMCGRIVITMNPQDYKEKIKRCPNRECACYEMPTCNLEFLGKGTLNDHTK